MSDRTEEDTEQAAELQLLRSTIKEFPHRTVRETDDSGLYELTQGLPDGRFVTTWVRAKSREEALMTTDLPYCPND